MTTNLADAVALDGVTKCYGPVRAVDGLDLAIAPGSTVALLGPNGAGKSTTVAMLLGLLPPDAGTVAVLGGSPHRAVRRGRVGAMLQTGALPANATVGELLTLVRGQYPRPLPLGEIVEVAGIGDLLGRMSNRLSGGQTQRVRFALALAGDPDLLIVDEPTAALDVEARREFWAGMRAFVARGRTLVFSTHYLTEADDYADRIVMIAAGRVVADGTPEQLKRTVAGRTVSVDLVGRSTAGLESLPGVTAVEVRGERAHLRSTDSDATVTALVHSRGGVHGLEVTGTDLEDAFVTLTGTGSTQHGAYLAEGTAR